MRIRDWSSDVCSSDLYALEDAIKTTIRHHRNTQVGPIRFSYAKPYLVCHLPSGRNIYYLKPRVTKRPFRYIHKDTGEEVVTMKDTISYIGKTPHGNNWTRNYSNGGKFIANMFQAVGRDLYNEKASCRERG